MAVSLANFTVLFHNEEKSNKRGENHSKSLSRFMYHYLSLEPLQKVLMMSLT